MKFGGTFTEYLHGDQERFFDKCFHVEYKRLKKVLQSCRSCKALHDSVCKTDQQGKENHLNAHLCQCQSACQLCDHMFFSELMKEASDIAGSFSSRARHLLHLHVASGMQKYVLRVRQCFKNDQQVMLEEGRMLIEYISMNTIAICKILKKYDKDIVFNPYALSCGHLFCKSCACSAASVWMVQGLKSASPESKCPICREAGVYANAVHMLELDLLLKGSFKQYWKERLIAERAEIVKQSKDYWDLQTRYMIGH